MRTDLTTTVGLTQRIEFTLPSCQCRRRGGLGPLAHGGLDEAFSLAVGARNVGTGEAVLNVELEAGGAELLGAIARAVVGELAANGDAVLGVEGDGGAQVRWQFRFAGWAPCGRRRGWE
jgi:hypothetical protein